MTESDNYHEGTFTRWIAALSASNYGVPFHMNRDNSPILLRQISKDIGLTVEEFIRNR